MIAILSIALQISKISLKELVILIVSTSRLLEIICNYNCIFCNYRISVHQVKEQEIATNDEPNEDDYFIFNNTDSTLVMMLVAIMIQY